MDPRVFDPQKALTPSDERFDWKSLLGSPQSDRVEDFIREKRKEGNSGNQHIIITFTMQIICVLLFILFSAIQCIAAVPGDTTWTSVDTVIFQGEVVVTARRQGLGSFKLPAVTAAINANTLRQVAPRTVPEALTGIPGVFVQKTNHGGGSPFLRGLTGQQTLLLLDGIRINNATFRSGPNQYLNTLDPGWVGRMEVVLNSGSVEYGSDAIGGVVNVLTHALKTTDRTVWRPEAAFKWTSGGQETGSEAALSALGKNFALRIDGAFRNFGDLIGGEGIGRQSPTGYAQWSYAFKGLWQPNERLGVTVLWQDLEQEEVPLYHRVKLENFAFYHFQPQRRNLCYVRMALQTDQAWRKEIELTASRQYNLEGRISQRNGQARRVEESDRTLTYGLQASVRSNFSRFWYMNTGAEWYADAVGSEKFEVATLSGTRVRQRGLYPDGAGMQSLALFNLHTLNWQRLTLTAGLRYNAFSITVPDEVIGTSRITPRALVGQSGLSFEFWKHIRVFANMSTAFRAPNVDDLGTLGIVDFRYEVPNSQLEPEKSRSAELGLKWHNELIQGSLAAYSLELQGLIGRVRSGDTLQGYPVFLKENVARAYIRGIETAWEWQIAPNWVFLANGTYTYGQNRTAGEPLRRIPPFHGRGLVRFQPKANLSLSVESHFAAAQRRLATTDKSDNRINPNGTPGWKTFHLRAWYRWGKPYLATEFHNIFNEAYRTHGSGVDGMGRSIWIKIGIGAQAVQ